MFFIFTFFLPDAHKEHENNLIKHLDTEAHFRNF